MLCTTSRTSNIRSLACVSTLLAAFLPTALAVVLAAPNLMINGITFQTRVHWTRLANKALGEISGSPCLFAAFGTVIVNHTASDAGELICMGVNENGKTGSPSLHGKRQQFVININVLVRLHIIGEIAAIKNCTGILTDPHGKFRMTASEAQDAFADLTLYTNAESCPMV